MAQGNREADRIKSLLSDRVQRIALHDAVALIARETTTALSEKGTPSQPRLNGDELQEELRVYEELTGDLRTSLCLLAYWGAPEHQRTLAFPLSLLADWVADQTAGRRQSTLAWYPLLLAMYSSGIGAEAAADYGNMATVLHARAPLPSQYPVRGPLATAVGQGITRLNHMLKELPEKRTPKLPLNERLFKLLEPEMVEHAYLDNDYEFVFDRFEVFLALEHAHLSAEEESDRVWGPPGRFAWKFGRRGQASPLNQVLQEAEGHGGTWPPLESGMFGGSRQRLQDVSERYAQWLGEARFNL